MNNFKRQVRDRMEQFGENYTTARAKILKERAASSEVEVVVEDGFYPSGEGGDLGWYVLRIGSSELFVSGDDDDMRALVSAIDAKIDSPRLLAALSR